MRTLDAFLHDPGVAPILDRIAWTLLHFLWQGVALAALLGILLFCLRHRSAQSRYLAACLILVVMMVCPVITSTTLKAGQERATRTVEVTKGRESAPQIQPGVPVPPAPTSAGPSKPAPASRPIVSLLPWVVVLWLAGVGFLSLRLLGGWIAVQRLSRRACRPITGALYVTMMDLAHRIGIKRLPNLLVSEIVPVPTVIGCLRSVILLPTSAVVGLGPEMLETILLHELAHIRRYDYLVNLCQSAVETLLFYHPAVWWVSHTIRTEREHCCDDLVISVLEDRKTYACALAGLEELRTQSLALAATDGSLLRRIRRILGERSMHTRITPNFLIACTGLSLLLMGYFLYVKVAPSRHPLAVPAVPRVMPPPPPPEITLDILQDNSRDFSGLTELHGPGIVMTLHDSNKALRASNPEDAAKYLIRDQDLQSLVNGLFAAGAEAISIGDQRIVSRSSIRAVGPFIQINGTSVTSPFVIHAIGEPDALFKAASLPNGSLNALQFLDADRCIIGNSKDVAAVIEKKEDVVVPAFRGNTRMRYARPTGQVNVDIVPEGQAVEIEPAPEEGVATMDNVNVVWVADAPQTSGPDTSLQQEKQEELARLKMKQAEIAAQIADLDRLKAERAREKAVKAEIDIDKARAAIKLDESTRRQIEIEALRARQLQNQASRKQTEVLLPQRQEVQAELKAALKRAEELKKREELRRRPNPPLW